MEEIFEVQVVATDIGQSHLLGVLAAGNSNGVCVPSFIMKSELEFLREQLDIPVEPISTELTALGNNILCNNKRAMVNPEFDKEARTILAEVLNVEVIVGTIDDRNTVGSTAVLTTKGCLAPPIKVKEELLWLNEVFGVSVSVGTINAGDTFVGSGLIANSKGAIAGLLTTGPELARVGLALDL
jgi:translation initiation factor 6